MNKIREELARPFNGLPVETLDKLESIVKNNSILFSSFCTKNYTSYKVKDKPIIWEGTMNRRYTT